jgi:xanthine/uracil/vitamin C permease (AzgA family)
LLLILGLTNAIELVNRIIPRSVVSGLQLGVGASLALRGINMVVQLSTWWVGRAVEEEGHQLLLDCRLLALASAVVALYMMREGSKAPVGIVLFGMSAIVAIAQMVTDKSSSSSSWFQLQVAPFMSWSLEGATWSDWKTGLLEGALPQLPLSTLNTVISTCCLAESLYPQRHSNGGTPTRRQMSISVGFLNLLLCPLGAMPTCNGAGGLAGQHKFGKNFIC